MDWVRILACSVLKSVFMLFLQIVPERERK